MKYIIAKRLQLKEKRFEKLKDLYKSIFEQRTKLFDADKLVKRELEKARFSSYQVSDTYDRLRRYVKKTMQPFNSAYFRTFDDGPLQLKKKLNKQPKLFDVKRFDYKN